MIGRASLFCGSSDFEPWAARDVRELERRATQEEKTSTRTVPM